MVTVRQIEKHWSARQHLPLARLLLAARPEASARLEQHLAGQAAAGSLAGLAALAVIRLDELGMSYCSLSATCLRVVLGSQSADGIIGDLVTSGLALRALATSQGHGAARDALLHRLAEDQRADGLWSLPDAPGELDFYGSAMVLFLCSGDIAARLALRLHLAAEFFQQRLAMVTDPEARRLWDRAAVRCRQLKVTPALAASILGGGTRTAMPWAGQTQWRGIF